MSRLRIRLSRLEEFEPRGTFFLENLGEELASHARAEFGGFGVIGFHAAERAGDCPAYAASAGAAVDPVGAGVDGRRARAVDVLFFTARFPTAGKDFPAVQAVARAEGACLGENLLAISGFLVRVDPFLVRPKRHSDQPGHLRLRTAELLAYAFQFLNERVGVIGVELVFSGHG